MTKNEADCSLARHWSRRAFLASASAALTHGFWARTASAQDVAKPGPFKTPEDLDASLASAGVGPEDRRFLLGLARPGAALVSKAAPDAEIAVGASKFGGAPDLPVGSTWPTRQPSPTHATTIEKQMEGVTGDYLKELQQQRDLARREAPLVFMLQVDLAASWAARPIDPDIPRTGRLALFYDYVLNPWEGHDRDGTARFALLYFDEAAEALARRPPPDLGMPLFGGEAYREFASQMPPARLTPIVTLTLPDSGSMPFLLYHPSPIPHDAWLEEMPAHLNASNRLGGWPENIQGDMAISLAADEAGIELPYGEAFAAAAKALQSRADQWVMLLQMGDYDNAINDFDGLFYVWIKREHLKARDFSKARLVYQTT